MRDSFDLLGLPTNARASEIRQRFAHWSRRQHPDFGGDTPIGRPSASESFRADAAVDFVSMASFVDVMQQAFFGKDPRASRSDAS